MTEEQLEKRANALTWCVENYGAEYSLLALGAVASARTGKHFEVFELPPLTEDRKSTRLNSSHLVISYAVFCLKKKKIHFFSLHPLTLANTYIYLTRSRFLLHLHYSRHFSFAILTNPLHNYYLFVSICLTSFSY